VTTAHHSLADIQDGDDEHHIVSTINHEGEGKGSV